MCVDLKRAAAEETAGLIAQEVARFGGEAFWPSRRTRQERDVRRVVDACRRSGAASTF